MWGGGEGQERAGRGLGKGGGPLGTQFSALLVLKHHHPGIWGGVGGDPGIFPELDSEGKKALDSDSGGPSCAGAGGVSSPGLFPHPF